MRLENHCIECDQLSTLLAIDFCQYSQTKTLPLPAFKVSEENFTSGRGMSPSRLFEELYLRSSDTVGQCRASFSLSKKSSLEWDSSIRKLCKTFDYCNE